MKKPSKNTNPCWLWWKSSDCEASSSVLTPRFFGAVTSTPAIPILLKLETGSSPFFTLSWCERLRKQVNNNVGELVNI